MKALSDQGRLRALLLLRNGELCLCQIIEILELAPSTVSKHMSILKQAGLVESRKEERWNYFRLPGRNTNLLIEKIINLVAGELAGTPTAANDQKRLAKVLSVTPVELCKTHKSLPSTA